MLPRRRADLLSKKVTLCVSHEIRKARFNMGNNIPATIPEFINWCTAHGSQWSSSPTVIGLTSGQMTAYNALLLTMTKANAEAETARNASKDATIALRNAISSMRALSGIYVDTIKNFAESTHNPNVYALASISPPSPAGTPPLPVAPTTFTASVNTDGSLTIKWKATQPMGATGVLYRVMRRINTTEGPYTIVSTEGSGKSFTDLTLPVGVDRVEYIIQPTRTGGVIGPQSPLFTVQFGTLGGGGMNISTMQTVQHAEPMKIAA